MSALPALVAAPPLLAAALLLPGAGRLERHAAPLASAAALASVGAAALLAQRGGAALWPWLPHGAGALTLHLSGAGAAGVLALAVAAVAVPVFLYAWPFMAADAARARFFGFLSLFLGAMLVLALAQNLLTALLAWELMGACSYALIGHWYDDPARVTAATRAFLVTRGADLGLYGAAMAAYAGGNLAFAELGALAAPWGAAVAAGLLLAAFGKSAQLPFSGWLSGAMQGPTPVSALLHSATLVAAGVILLLKAWPVLSDLPWARTVLLWGGLASALTAALIALHQDRTKQALAASTVSQYGYLMAALGAAAPAAASLHLMVHAAFKALLFLCAGVLVQAGLHRAGETAGAPRRTPRLALLVGIGIGCLAALPPLGGFFSKEPVVSAIGHAGPVAHALVLLATALTAAYALQLGLGLFIAPPGARVRPVPEAPPRLAAAMAPLALASLAGALLAWPAATEALARRLGFPPPPAAAPRELALSVAMIALGAGFIAWRWRQGRMLPAAPLPGLAFLAGPAQRWFGLVRAADRAGMAALAAAHALARFDAQRLATVPALAGRAGRATAHAATRFDRDALDRLVHTAAARAMGLGRLARGADARLIEGLIRDLIAALHAGAAMLRAAHGGLVHRYYAQLAGALAVAVVLAWWWR